VAKDEYDKLSLVPAFEIESQESCQVLQRTEEKKMIPLVIIVELNNEALFHSRSKERQRTYVFLDDADQQQQQ
jgi:hypothetical protein